MIAQLWLRRIVLPLPFALLLLWITGTPLPLPHFIAPKKTYFVPGESTLRISGKKLLDRTGNGTLHLVLPDRIVTLPRNGIDRDAVDSPMKGFLERERLSVPENPVFGSMIADMERNPGLPVAFRIVTDRKPSMEELRSIRAAADGRRVELVIAGVEGESPVQAAIRKLDSLSSSMQVEILLSPSAVLSESLTIRSEGTGEPLFSGKGTDIPDDRTIRAELDRSVGAGLTVEATMPDGVRLERRFRFESEEKKHPPVLLISERDGSTIFDSAYDVTKVSQKDAAGIDLSAYELVVLDGLPLSSIPDHLASRLSGIVETRSGSLLFVADSPDFGIQGANPRLEALMPVTLLPRSLKNLPDMAILILIDTSGSMFGDKLSLAKITGLELLRNLKPEDAIGMILFSDRREWIYRFEANSGLRPAMPLEPVTAGGGTDLGPVLREGIAALARERLPEKHIVIISDGISKPDDFASIAGDAVSRGITISTMGVGKDADARLLASISARTGGRHFLVDSVDRIPSLIFEDRTSIARPQFSRGRISIVALDGSRTGEVSGMAQYTVRQPALVPFANESGDPLFASREYGNRATLFFGSDIRGGMTANFFSVAKALSIFRARLDVLFTEVPLEIRIAEMYGLTQTIVRGDRLVAPGIAFSRSGYPEIVGRFERSPSGLWSCALALPESGPWHARILDRGTTVSGFSLMANVGFSGRRTEDESALVAFTPGFFALLPRPELWLYPFFATCLLSSILLRRRR